ncbi:hypothetical protein KIN20_006195 [Parelaphostrongylus tenuis]|uniref:Uncharacterized protein n=1 Tax=Parelaphostrongylus tenuis TaxID=148309 RepID=A0AAD5QI42_PARTN|nr:hypothetical protein KIN20_006195 [Parelaphostrongylus tenuis]
MRRLVEEWKGIRVGRLDESVPYGMGSVDAQVDIDWQRQRVFRSMSGINQSQPYLPVDQRGTCETICRYSERNQYVTVWESRKSSVCGAE